MFFIAYCSLYDPGVLNSSNRNEFRIVNRDSDGEGSVRGGVAWWDGVYCYKRVGN